MSLWNQEAPRLILASGRSFREDLVMKLFLRPFFLFRLFKKSSCQLMAKGCALSTGYLPRGGLPRNSVDRITDRPDMTSAVDRERKASTQTQNPISFGYIWVQTSDFFTFLGTVPILVQLGKIALFSLQLGKIAPLNLYENTDWKCHGPIPRTIKIIISNLNWQ